MSRETEGSLVGGAVGVGDKLAYTEASPPNDTRWSAVFAGAVAALSLWLMLYTFGLALGLSTMDPQEPGSFKSSGIFTGIWGLVSPLIALFVGGVIAGRGAGTFERGNGAIHGFVMWGLTALAGAWLVTSLLSYLVSGVAGAGKSLMQAGGAAVTSVAGQAGKADDIVSALGLSAQDAIRPLNQRLRAEGKSEVTPAQLQAVARDVAQDAIRQGRVDRNLLVQSVSQHTALTAGDADELATSLEREIDSARARLSAGATDLKEAATTRALQAADTTGKVFWGVFGALFLGLASAIAGGIVGVGLHQREAARHGGRVPYVQRRTALASDVR